MPKNPARNTDRDDTKATASRKPRKVTATAAEPPAATFTRDGVRSPRTGPADAAGPKSISDRELDIRWANATDVGRLNRLYCTGSPDCADCEEPAAIAIALNGRLFSLPCRSHFPDVMRAILSRGHEDCRTVSLSYFVELRGSKLVQSSCDYIRAFNRNAGVHIPDRPSTK
jgi:hypothetical protein